MLLALSVVSCNRQNDANRKHNMITDVEAPSPWHKR